MFSVSRFGLLEAKILALHPTLHPFNEGEDLEVRYRLCLLFLVLFSLRRAK